MDIPGRLVSTLPKLRTQIQLTGLVVIVGGVIFTYSIAPENLHAQISAGAIGVAFLVFGQIFHYLGTVEEQQRPTLILAAFFGFLAFVLALVLITGMFMYVLGKNVDGNHKTPGEKSVSKLANKIRGCWGKAETPPEMKAEHDWLQENCSKLGRQMLAIPDEKLFQTYRIKKYYSASYAFATVATGHHVSDQGRIQNAKEAVKWADQTLSLMNKARTGKTADDRLTVGWIDERLMEENIKYVKSACLAVLVQSLKDDKEKMSTKEALDKLIVHMRTHHETYLKKRPLVSNRFLKLYLQPITTQGGEEK